MAGLLASCLSLFQTGVWSVLAFFYGLVDGFSIGALLGAYTLFVVKGVFRELERRLPFLILLIVNSFVYLSVFVCVRAIVRY